MPQVKQYDGKIFIDRSKFLKPEYQIKKVYAKKNSRGIVELGNITFPKEWIGRKVRFLVEVVK